MINDKKLFLPLFTPRNICCGYFLESPRRGNSNKYPQHRFFGLLNIIFLNITYHLPHLELRNCSIQIVVITNFAIVSNVSIKRFDCTSVLILSWILNLNQLGTKCPEWYCKEGRPWWCTTDHIHIPDRPCESQSSCCIVYESSWRTIQVHSMTF